MRFTYYFILLKIYSVLVSQNGQYEYMSDQNYLNSAQTSDP